MLSKLTQWLGTRRRDRALRDYAIDDALWQATLDGLPFLAHLDAPDLARLRELTSLFIAQKEFSTAHELELTDAMTVAIAAQACLPVLNLSLDLYRGWVGVIVYPGEFVIRKTVEDEDGVVHEVEHDASGEAWEGGPVVLSWEDAQMTDGTDAYNVVIHEFAHKIDMLNGEADGHPPLMRRWHAPLDSQAWADVFDHAYDHFCAQSRRGAGAPLGAFRARFADRSVCGGPSIGIFCRLQRGAVRPAAGVRSGVSGALPAARALLPAGSGAVG